MMKYTSPPPPARITVVYFSFCWLDDDLVATVKVVHYYPELFCCLDELFFQCHSQSESNTDAGKQTLKGGIRCTTYLHHILVRLCLWYFPSPFRVFKVICRTFLPHVFDAENRDQIIFISAWVHCHWGPERQIIRFFPGGWNLAILRLAI